ncbi:YbaK/EbsC family protein [Oscillospiraceae bacterium OttesenSCG-928-G22]|nr:YbaK/EbsC family protein [Oscillospiraceae bacterium OttesenSCG-928-G22]
MSVDTVRTYLKQFSRDADVMEFQTSTATVLEAAASLCTEPARIAKTLSVYYNEKALIVVVAGDAKLSNGKFRAQFSFKPRMLSAPDVERLTGHVVGGVCPFALPEGTPVYLDVSLKRFETVFPACGSTNSAIELTIPELERLSGSLGFVDVCKDPEPQA